MSGFMPFTLDWSLSFHDASLVFLIVFWILFWKGKALWRAAKNGQKYWFMALLVINTLGILEIIYLKFFSKCVCSPAKKTTK